MFSTPGISSVGCFQAYLWVEQQILRLDVAMADAQGVDVRERSGELIQVKLHQDDGERLLALVVLPRNAVDSLRYKLQHEVQVQLIRLLQHMMDSDRKQRAATGGHHQVFMSSKRVC